MVGQWLVQGPGISWLSGNHMVVCMVVDPQGSKAARAKSQAKPADGRIGTHRAAVADEPPFHFQLPEFHPAICVRKGYDGDKRIYLRLCPADPCYVEQFLPAIDHGGRGGGLLIRLPFIGENEV